jgi:hypothetical protein
MRKSYLVLATAAGLSLAVGAPAEAGNGRTGGGGSAFTPPGLISGNSGFTNDTSNKSDHIFAAPSQGTTTGYGPSGWSHGTQGNGDTWKTLSSPPGSSPPGLSK